MWNKGEGINNSVINRNYQHTHTETKTANVLQPTDSFSLCKNGYIFIQISLKYVPTGPIKWATIGSDDGLASYRRQAIVWTMMTYFCWGTNAPLVFGEITLCSATLKCIFPLLCSMVYTVHTMGYAVYSMNYTVYSMDYAVYSMHYAPIHTFRRFFAAWYRSFHPLALWRCPEECW